MQSNVVATAPPEQNPVSLQTGTAELGILHNIMCRCTAQPRRLTDEDLGLFIPAKAPALNSHPCLPHFSGRQLCTVKLD